MKKIFAVTAAAMAVSLAGCGILTPPPPSASENAQAESTSTQSASTESASTENTSTENSSTESTSKSDASSEKTSYTIGICQHVQHPALDAATEGFEDALTELLGDSVTFQLQNASGDSATCSTIANQFVSSGVDLIMANGTAPLQSSAAATDEIPVLGTSVTNYGLALEIDNWTGASGRNISGTSDLAPLSEQAAMLNELLPESEYPNIGILYCSAEPNSKYQSTEIIKELEALGYSCKEYTFADSNDIATVTTAATNECDALYIPTDNAAASNTEVINNICEPAGIPIIAGEEGICEGCGIATLSIDYYELGYETGEMAYEILVNGADISTMEVRYAPNVTKKYYAERCDKLGIEVPEGYEAIEVTEE